MRSAMLIGKLLALYSTCLHNHYRSALILAVALQALFAPCAMPSHRWSSCAVFAALDDVGFAAMFLPSHHSDI